MANHDKQIVSYAQGAGRNLAKAVNKTSSWADLCKLLSTPTVTAEKHKAYMAMNRDQQLHLKSVNGWISGAPCEGNYRNLRNVKPRDLTTLDCDYPWDTFWPDIESGDHWLCTYEFAALSTRSSTDKAPRYRVVLPMTRKVTPDEYGPLVRIISLRIDYENRPMEQVDVVSSRKAQMMFLPTISKDQPFEFKRNEGKLLDPDEQFAWFEEHHGDWRDLTILPLYKGEEKLRAKADKAEDPWLKPGVIGDWCRAWPIEDLIAEFLSDIYVPGDSGSGKPRYTYTGGSASNGAVVEDDGRFLYSHHGTDPVGEQLVNAWDLYRVHKFGHLDDKAKEDTSIMDMPSSKAMRDFVATDKKFQAERIKSKYDTAAFMDDADVGEADEDDLEVEEPEYTAEEAPVDDLGFSDDDLGPADPDEPPQKPKAKKAKADKNPNKDWFAEELEFDQNGNIKSTIHNVAAILYNDPRFYGKIRYDQFGGTVRLFGNIKSKSPNVPDMVAQDQVNGDRWSELGHITIRAILATPNGSGKTGYGLGTVAERDVAGAVMLCAMRNAYHPVKDFLEAEPWDGVKRVENLFVDFLGTADHAYHRETAKLVMVASVARIYEPGHKFDYAPVLEGPQGIRKSSFIAALYGNRWFGELACDLGDMKQVAEALGGKWGVELPELASLTKSDQNDAKAFMSRQEDVVRMAYHREVTEIRRQSVFWGTTNDETYLKDRSGNRRYWPQKVGLLYIDTAALTDVRQQLWAEALALYNEMRATYPANQHESLPLMLTGSALAEAVRQQEGARERQMDEDWAQHIQDYLDHPITIQSFASGYERQPEDFLDKGVNPDNVWVQRTVFTNSDAATAVGLEWPVKNGQYQKTLERAVKALLGWEPDRGGKRYKRWGSMTVTWYAREGESAGDILRGFKVVDAPESHDAEFVDDYGLTDDDLGPEYPDEDIDNLV